MHKEQFNIMKKICIKSLANSLFTITAEIHARSLAKFYSQYADRHEFEIRATRQLTRAGNSTVFYRRNQIDVIVVDCRFTNLTSVFMRLFCY